MVGREFGGKGTIPDANLAADVNIARGLAIRASRMLVLRRPMDLACFELLFMGDWIAARLRPFFALPGM